MLIAFTGLAGSGKTTAANYLICQGFRLVKFAEPIKIMMIALGLENHHIDGYLKEKPCDLLGGKTPRFAMQTLGTEWGRNTIDHDLWVRVWRKRAESYLNAGFSVVSDDCRFPNEAIAVRDLGGTLAIVERPRLVAGSHKSETSVLLLPAEVRIANDGSLSGLFQCIDKCIEGVR